MSHDGSSCKSYIKHPTEKERLDNLAFTSFPEDYLPYTSAYHQQGGREGGKAPPYLVWEERRGRRSRKRRRGCCSTAALVSAIALIVAAILAVVAISVYLGVVTNLFRSPVLSLSGKFRVTNGDEFSDALLNVTSYQFLIKAETYQAMVENVFLSSSLEPAFIAARIYAFRPGMLVFFRVYLDRRKLKQDDINTIEIVKDLIRSDSPAFGALTVDQESVEVDENEEWLAAPGLDLRIAKMSTPASQPITPRPDSKPSSSTRATEYPRRPVLATRKPKKPPTSAPSPALTPSIDPVPIREISGTGTGHVVAVGPVNPEEDSHFSYGQWRPVPIEDSVSPSFGDQRTPPGRGSVRLLDESVPSQAQRPYRPSSGSSPLNVGIGSVKVLEDPLSHVDPAPVPVRNSRPLRPIISDAQRGEVASSIMSSVSLVVRQPNKKNQTSTLPESGRLEMARPIQNKTKYSDAEGSSANDDSAFTNRNDHASYRFLEKIESAVKETTYSTDSSDWLDVSSTFNSEIIGLAEEKNIQDINIVPSNLQDTELHQEIHKSTTVNIKSEKNIELKESQIPGENTNTETTQGLLVTQELKENLPNKELFGLFPESALSEANPNDDSLPKISTSDTNSNFTTYKDASSTVDYPGDLAELDLSTNVMSEKDEQEINIQSLKSHAGVNKTYLLKYTTINSYTAPTENVDLIDVLLLDDPEFRNKSIANTAVKDNLEPFFNSTQESEDISMVTSTISHTVHKSENVANEANETDSSLYSMMSENLNNSQQMHTLNVSETITGKEDSEDSNENFATTTEDISLYISELNILTEKAPLFVTHSASETKLHTIKDLGESLTNNFSIHTLEGHGFHKPHFSVNTMSPANNAEKHDMPTSQSAAIIDISTEESTTVHHNFVKSFDIPKEIISTDNINTSAQDLSHLDSSKLTLSSDSVDSSDEYAVYTDASAYSSSQNVEDASLSTINHQTNDEITVLQTVQNNETRENIFTDTSENVTSDDSLITGKNEDGLNVTTVILSGVPKIVPQFSALHFNPNDIESDDEGIIELDDDLMHEQQTTQNDQDTIRDKTEIIRHITTLAPTTVMPVSLGKYPVFISKSCSEDEMLCDSGECVESSSRCNMRRDCRDNSDEKNCTCTDLLKVLGQSQKICDGVEDCQDRSDEQNCPWCKAGQYICPQTKFCINRTQVCDGHDDCPLGNDEKYCVRLAESVPDAESLHYRSSGYLMVRKKGQWGKLCLESVQDSLVLRRKLDELGKAVCTTLTYKNMSGSKRVHDTTMGSEFYYEISSEASREVRKSTTIFQQSMCKSKDVIKVECGDLECGIRPMVIANRRRIVGGQSTVSGSWPWQVALYKEGDFQCGAVLISDTWLISAGHCFYSTQTAYWTARLGLLRRGSELPSPSEEIRRIEQIILHPDYEDQGFINDIALLKMDKPVMFSDYLRPVCLPTESEDAGLWHGKQCSVVGWGKLYEIGHTFPDSLQEVRLPVISTEECRKKIIFLTMYHLTDNMFCAGYERGGRDACLGDSGGPLMCQRNDGRWLLLGVTSNGDGCGRPNRPGVYTKVTQYLPWIRSILDKKHTSQFFEDKCDGIRCKLGRCIPQYKICDGRWDCSEGSDEDHCED